MNKFLILYFPDGEKMVIPFGEAVSTPVEIKLLTLDVDVDAEGYEGYRKVFENEGQAVRVEVSPDLLNRIAAGFLQHLSMEDSCD